MKQIALFASGDSRPSANQMCWPAQRDMEVQLSAAFAAAGYELVRAHAFDPEAGHGFLASQRQGLDAFATVDPDMPVVVAEAVWQYSHHVLPGLLSHRGPVLTVANWSGQWPGLVGMLNLNGSLTKAGRDYSTLWSADFTDGFFIAGMQEWLSSGTIKTDVRHVQAFEIEQCADDVVQIAQRLFDEISRDKVILGVFDEGCMGMFNAIVPDELLHPLGFFKERLSQSALYYATQKVPDNEAQAVFDWLLSKGLKFNFGDNEATELTQAQVLTQCKMYIAAVRLAEEFSCNAIGIQYQQGLKDLLPASDLVEGMLNNQDRPPVQGDNGEIRAGAAIPHFNEVDECAAIDAVLTNKVHAALGQPVENTLHDVRWGDEDHSGTVEEFVWCLQISGAAPPAHHINGWAGSSSMRQPPMYFRLGGGTLRGLAKPGEIIWSRVYVTPGQICMDIGRGSVIELPEEETERRWKSITYEWPLMHAVLHGVSRDQFMARHKANHIQVVYATDALSADKAMQAKAALAQKLGIKVSVCGVTQTLGANPK